jgi:exosome complex RNA-binding protein Rrp42 (RNase PH superfamily)
VRHLAYEEYPGLMMLSGQDTLVVMTYRHGVCKPYFDRPGAGIFNITVQGKKSDKLLRCLHDVYFRHKCVTIEGKRDYLEVEFLCIDIKVIDDDGGLFRVCIAGINRILHKLKIRCLFYPVAIQYCSIDNQIITDPDLMELESSDWNLSIVARSGQEILYMKKVGSGCTPECLLNLLERTPEDVNV